MALGMLALAGCSAGVSVGARIEPGRMPEVIGIQEAKDAVAVHYVSGRYELEVARVASRIREHVEERLAAGVQGRPAVVFDIDDTLLSSFEVLRRQDFALNACGREALIEAVLAYQLPAIKPMRELYVELYRKVSVFIVSDRNEGLRIPSMENLVRAGFPGWHGFFMPASDARTTAAEFKAQVRKGLVEQGYVILANVGDQDSDFAGGHSEADFRVPNYLYGLR
jgi:acid phosphatase